MSFVNPRKGRGNRFQMFFRIGVLKNFANFIRKNLCWKRLQHRCFPLKFRKFLRTSYSTLPVAASENGL